MPRNAMCMKLSSAWEFYAPIHRSWHTPCLQLASAAVVKVTRISTQSSSSGTRRSPPNLFMIYPETKSLAGSGLEAKTCLVHGVLSLCYEAFVGTLKLMSAWTCQPGSMFLV